MKTVLCMSAHEQVPDGKEVRIKRWKPKEWVERVREDLRENRFGLPWKIKAAVHAADLTCFL